MVLGHSRESSFTKTKNSTNEASMLLKTKRGFQKRTQNELKTNPKLSAQMREVEPKLEVFDIVRVGAGDWIVGEAAGTELARLGETRGTAGEIKNTGNKARMSKKTKHITFLNAANQGLLCANRHKSGPEGSKGNLGKRGQAAASQGEAGEVTKIRLHKVWVCTPSAGARPEAARMGTLP